MAALTRAFDRDIVSGSPLWVESSSLKTRMCPHFAQGRCWFESRCKFAHHVSELQVRADHGAAKMCPAWVHAGSHSEQWCFFAHDDAEFSGPMALVDGSAVHAYSDQALGQSCTMAMVEPSGLDYLDVQGARPDQVPMPLRLSSDWAHKPVFSRFGDELDDATAGAYQALGQSWTMAMVEPSGLDYLDVQCPRPDQVPMPLRLTSAWAHKPVCVRFGDELDDATAGAYKADCMQEPVCLQLDQLNDELDDAAYNGDTAVGDAMGGTSHDLGPSRDIAFAKRFFCEPALERALQSLVRKVQEHGVGTRKR